MAKRGASGLSLLVAVDKPIGMTSHDVVNRVRRVFGERRVGHTGTLDPLATGVLPICVGPATRLDQYMTGHDKRYRVIISFGCETTTDDVEGEITATGEARGQLYDEEFARAYLSGVIGCSMQVPPQYSAIKVGGKKAYEVARSGGDAALEPRPIEVYGAALHACTVDEETGMPLWSVDFAVSKGTYIRALARDIGRDLGCPAHVGALQRRQAGAIQLEDCVSLKTLEARGQDAALDPVSVLGFRYAFGDGFEKRIGAGGTVPASGLRLCERLPLNLEQRGCACMSSVVKSDENARPGERVSIVVENRLKAIYEYSAERDEWKPACVFSTGIMRA